MKTGDKVSAKRFLLYQFELQAPNDGPDGTRTRNLAINSRCSSTSIRQPTFQMNSSPRCLLYPGRGGFPAREPDTQGLFQTLILAIS